MGWHPKLPFKILVGEFRKVEGDEMSFYRDTVRTARKEHKCELCGEMIQKGKRYHDKASNEFGDIFYAKECEKCQPVINEFCNSDYYHLSEGYCPILLHEWWIDYKCPECKHSCNDEKTHYCRCERFEAREK